MSSKSSIRLRRSSVPGRIPSTNNLDLGEVAINTHDGKMFFKQDANGVVSIVEIAKRDEVAKVLYVSESGDDDNDGKTLSEPFLTIDAALSVANTGDTVFVKSGDYYLDNTAGGVVVPANVSIVGDNLRTTNIYGSEANNDLFYVNNASHITGVTFRGHTNGAAAVAFPPDGSAGSIITSPYVQNCTSFSGNGGVGMRIDGSVVSGLRSMVSDAFTQINFGGTGVHLLNKGYAQLVSIFTVSCDVGILAEDGGQCSLTNSNCSFGNYGLKATGVSSSLYSGAVSGDFVSLLDNEIVITGLAEKPKYGDAIKFSSDDSYYTVDGATDLSANTSTVTLLEELSNDLADGTAVTFHKRSLIQASSITFEYVGTGTGIYDTPESGAFPIQENEVTSDEDNGGLVYFTSTDHKGDFRIGGDLAINRESGTIQGLTFDRSLFAVMTPYILALEGN